MTLPGSSSNNLVSTKRNTLFNSDYNTTEYKLKKLKFN